MFILIHGAWHGGWCWRKVAALLEGAGHAVVAPDLPGSGEDRMPVEEVTFERYAGRVAAILDSAPEPALLVGHSMGGAVISQVAEYRPERVRALVYVCAYLPENGESLKQAASRDTGSRAREAVEVSPDRRVMTLQPEVAREILYGAAGDDAARWAMSRLKPQATAPWRWPVALTPARYGRVPRFYVECLRDAAISLAFQREMSQRAGCRNVYVLDTDHSPFLSAPEQLARILLEVAAGTESATGLPDGPSKQL